MSYSLELYFEPAVRRERALAHFGARRRFSMKNDDVVYENRDTGVYFFMRLRSARKLFRSSIVSAEFEINYCRPSYFGIEAEKVLSDFVAVFQPRIEDPQIQGMGEGPYSGEGFLSGWNSAICLPPATLCPPGITSRLSSRRAPATQSRLVCAGHCFLPHRRPRQPRRHLGRGDADSAAQGRPRLGRASRFRRSALRPRALVRGSGSRRGAGLDATNDPLKLDYRVTPPPIADWVANIPLIDLDALEKLSADKILDDELIAAAREFETKVIPDHSDGQA
jgi:hypothetical protein